MTEFGVELSERFYLSAGYLLALMLAFIIGSSLAGYLVDGVSIIGSRHYDTILVIEALLLLVAGLCLSQKLPIGHLFAVAACGMQNAFASTYSGALIRTTHMTGLFTDLGIMLGRRMRGEMIDWRKLMIFILLILGFILGGACGAMLFHAYAFKALLLPVLTCLLFATIYRCCRLRGQLAQ